MAEEYFGYTTASNTQLNENRRLAARMGEDIRYYPPPQDGGDYPDPTIDWDNRNPYADADDDDPERIAAEANDSVERIYKRIMALNSEAVRAVAHQWWNVWRTLDDVGERVLQYATLLKEGGGNGDKGWTGAGAEAFLARGPGATLKSIDDWRNAAVQNALGSSALADQIDTYQGRIKDYFEQYKSEMIAKQNEMLSYYAVANLSELNEYYDEEARGYFVDEMRAASLEKAAGARAIQSEMAAAFRQVMWEDFAGGRETVYEGPTDAVEPNRDFINRYMAEKFSPNISVPNITAPNVTAPNITAPNINTTNITQLTKPTGTPPNITPPNVSKPDLPTQTTPTATPPSITQPNISVPHLPPPVVPPVVPPGLGPGGQQQGAPTIRPPAAPNVSGTGRLLGNLPGGTGPGVLRGANISPEGLPGGMPPGGRPGQAMPPPQIKGRGQPPGTPALPPQGKGGGTGKGTPATPGTPSTPGITNQFGGPPGTPASPVLRNPRSTPDGTRDPRRGTPSTAGPGTPPVPPRPGTSSPVLGRPRRASDTPITPTPQRPASGQPGAPANPLAPLPPRTSSPVVGRVRRDAVPAPEPQSGVVRGNRRPGSEYQGEIISRRREQEQPAVSDIDAEFDKLSKYLSEEAPWKVATPGGGVLDAAPPRANGPVAEPKPALGSS